MKRLRVWQQVLVLFILVGMPGSVMAGLIPSGASVGKVRASMDRLPTEDLYQIAVSMEGTQAESGVVGFAVLLIVVLLVALVIYMANKVGAHE